MADGTPDQRGGAPPASPPDTTGRPGLRANRDYLKLFTGQAVSSVGDAVTLFALPWLLAELTAKPAVLGLLTVVETAPGLLLALWFGVVVDGGDRRKIMIWTDAARALVVAAVPLLALSGSLAVWHILVVAAFAGAGRLLYDTAAFAYLPGLVGEGDLLAANSWYEVADQSSATAGPALAGALTSMLGAAGALVLDAASFAASAACTGAIPPGAAPTRAPSDEVDGGVRAGLRALRRTPALRALLATASAVNLFAGGIPVLYVLLLQRDLRASAVGAGLAFAAGGVGGILGGALAGRVGRRAGPRAALLCAGLLTAGGVGLAAAAHSLVVAGAAAAVVNGSIALYNVVAVATRQRHTPPELLGRVQAAFRFVTWGALPVSGAALGLLASVTSVRTAFVAAGAGLAVVFVALGPVLWRSFRDEGSSAGP